MFKILNVLTKVVDVIFSTGRERRKTAIVNLIFMGFAVLCAWGFYELYLITSGNLTMEGGCSKELAGETIGAIFGMIVCLFTGIYALIAGIVTQAVLLVFSFLGIIISRQRGANAVAFLIALISLGAVAVGVLFLFNII